jgi:hypothetical protein
MDVKGFSLQAALVKGICQKEETAIITYCVRKGIPYKVCNRLEDSPDGYIPCGKVDWCERFLPKERTYPDYYPEFLKDHLYRKVWKAENWPLGKKVFIKPADRHKRFTGFITSGTYRGKNGVHNGVRTSFRSLMSGVTMWRTERC